MKHGRGTRGAAPASNAAGRGDTPGTPLPARPDASRHVMPRGFHVFLADSRRCEPTQLRFGLICAESGRLGPESADSGRNSKKKKKVQNALFNLYINPTSAQFTQTPKHKLSWNVLVWILWVVFNLWKSCFSYYILLLLLNLVYVCIMWKSMLSNILKI